VKAMIPKYNAMAFQLPGVNPVGYQVHYLDSRRCICSDPGCLRKKFEIAGFYLGGPTLGVMWLLSRN